MTMPCPADQDLHRLPHSLRPPTPPRVRDTTPTHTHTILLPVSIGGVGWTFRRFSAVNNPVGVFSAVLAQGKQTPPLFLRSFFLNLTLYHPFRLVWHRPSTVGFAQVILFSRVDPPTPLTATSVVYL